MALTPSQLTTLKTDINANTGVGGEFENIPNTPDGNQTIADAYNQQASPDFFVWKTFVDTMAIKDVVNWTEVINRGDGEQFAFDLMIRDGGINPSKSNVRTGLQDIFSGPQGANTRSALLDLAARKSSRAEKLFADTAGGNGSTKINSANLTFEGKLTSNDVEAARNLP